MVFVIVSVFVKNAWQSIMLHTLGFKYVCEIIDCFVASLLVTTENLPLLQ
ncbi:hypothetical protein [Helicobacter rodentium]|nr:hypothetical protein [Helicobacter rodentium]